MDRSLFNTTAYGEVRITYTPTGYGCGYYSATTLDDELICTGDTFEEILETLREDSN